MEYNVIDADGHILEPPDLWEQYIEPKFREGCPKLVTAADGMEIFRVEHDDAVDLGRGKKRVSFGAVGAFGARDGSVSAKIPYSQGRKGGFDPHARIRHGLKESTLPFFTQASACSRDDEGVRGGGLPRLRRWLAVIASRAGRLFGS